MHPSFSSTRATGSTRGFTTVDPERQGVLAVGRTLSALAQSRSAALGTGTGKAPRRQQDAGGRSPQRGTLPSS